MPDFYKDDGAGRRRGSGIKRDVLTIRPAQWCADYVRSECERLGISQSNLLHEMVMLWIQSHQQDGQKGKAQP